MSDAHRLRLTVAGPQELVIELDGTVLPEGAERDPEVRALPRTPADRSLGQRRYEVTVDGWVLVVTGESAARADLRERGSRTRSAAGLASREGVRAQIPGRVVHVWVAPGEAVAPGQRLLAVEAMKMENEIRSPRGGTVASIAVAVGDLVELGDELAVIS